MRYATLPGSSKKASLISLGTAWFGTDIATDRAFELMDAFREAGGNFLDTAHMYANWVENGAGESERHVGAWLKRTNDPDMVVATKGADRGMTREGIRTQLDESFERMGVDHVDFYFLHCDNRDVPVGEILGWMNELAGEGRFDGFGCSNWRLDRMQEADAYAKANNLRSFDASQIGWSLARAMPKGSGQVYMDDDLMAHHNASKMPVMAYSAQAGGFFGGAYGPDGIEGMKVNENIVNFYGCDANYARLAAANTLAAQKGVTANQINLAYLVSQPFTGFAIAGANSVDRVNEACAAADVVLSADELASLEAAAAGL